jgi:hypothetical protein
MEKKLNESTDEEISEDGGSMFLENDGIYLQIHTVLLPIRPTSTRDM